MRITNAMKLLILEDEAYEINRFINCIDSRDDVKLIASTASVDEAIEYVKINNVEGIIVDIELQKGTGGTGLDFLAKLENLQIDIKPIIIVTTNVSSIRVHNTVRDRFGVDLVFCKKQKDYSPEMVINNFMLLKESLYHDTPASLIEKTFIETEENRKLRIENRINAELDNIGMSRHLKGRKYVFDAIYYLITNPDKEQYYLAYLMNKYKLVQSSVNNAIQHSINSAWNTTPYEDLEKYFTVRVDSKTGSPKPTQFIHYYVDKIKKTIN